MTKKFIKFEPFELLLHSIPGKEFYQVDEFRKICGSWLLFELTSFFKNSNQHLENFQCLSLVRKKGSTHSQYFYTRELDYV